MTGISLFKNWRSPSIVRRLVIVFMLTGVIIGFVFPVLVGQILTVPESAKTSLLILSISAGILMALVNIGIAYRVLLRKLNIISDMAQALGNRDITVRSDFHSNDIIGGIVSNMNRMAENLRNAFSEIHSATAEVEEAAERLHRISDETDQCLQNQQYQSEQVATAMNQMTATVAEVASNAEQAAAAATEAHTEARNGALIATEAIGGIDALISRVEEAGEVLDGLQTDSDNIGMVLEVIRGIAEQTNLLALNAAIEAARAGEQGRGFAVVADEVRTLASRTQSSTQEIHGIIERLQAKAVAAVEVMQQVKLKGEENSGQVERAAESLAEIAGSVSVVDTMNTQIASAAEEQRSVAEEINGNVHKIHEATEQTAAGTQQTASASEHLGQLVTSLRSALGGFRVN